MKMKSLAPTSRLLIIDHVPLQPTRDNIEKKQRDELKWWQKAKRTMKNLLQPTQRDSSGIITTKKKSEQEGVKVDGADEEMPDRQHRQLTILQLRNALKIQVATR